MSEMQWLLLVLVIVVVAGAYLYIRRQASDDPWKDMEGGAEAGDELDRDASLSGDSYIVGVRTVGQPWAGQGVTDEPDSEAPKQRHPAEPPWAAFDTSTQAPEKPAAGVEKIRPQRAPAGQSKLFIIHVASRDKSFFDGPDIHAALAAQKLQFGMHNIYHRITEADGVPESVYAVANMLKPGFLDPVEQDHLSTPGLTMFLQLPGPIDGTKAAREMLETAGAIAERLGGEVLDDKRSLLKAQTAQFMLDEAAELDRRQRVQAQR